MIKLIPTIFYVNVRKDHKKRIIIQRILKHDFLYYILLSLLIYDYLQCATVHKYVFWSKMLVEKCIQ